MAAESMETAGNAGRGLQGAGGGVRRRDGSGGGVGNWGTLRQPAPAADEPEKTNIAGTVATGAAAIGIAAVVAMYLRELSADGGSSSLMAGRSPKRQGGQSTRFGDIRVSKDAPSIRDRVMGS